MLASLAATAYLITRIPGGASAEPSAPPRTPPESGPKGEFSLPEAETAYLWEIERHASILGQNGFKKLGGALKEDNIQGVINCFAAEAVCKAPRDGEEVVLDDEMVKVKRVTETGSFTAHDRAKFGEHLLSYRRVFSAPPNAKFGIVRIFPSKRGELDGKWQLEGWLRLWGVWGERKPAEVDITFACTMRRPSKDKDAQQGFLYSFDITQVQVAKAERFLFEDVAKKRGIDPDLFHDNWKSKKGLELMTGGVFVTDFDRDGRLDVLITDSERTVLYRGLPDGRFEDVTEKVGLHELTSRALSASWVDIDGDGWDDLILNCVGGARVYRNDEGKQFVDYSSKSNLKRFLQYGDNLTVADYDRDGRLDLFCARGGGSKSGSWLSSRTGNNNSNLLLRNLGNWQFQDVTKASGTGGDDMSSFTAVWLDANNDNWPDLHVINELGDGELLINQGDGTFRKAPLSEKPIDFGSMGASAGDLDNDGNIDLFLANMYSKAGSRLFSNLRPDTYPPEVMHRIHNLVKGNTLHRNLGGLKFEEVGKKMQVHPAGWPYGNLLADLNNDGFLDVFCTAGFLTMDKDEADG